MTCIEWRIQTLYYWYYFIAISNMMDFFSLTQ